MLEYNEDEVFMLAQAVLRLTEDELSELPPIVVRAGQSAIRNSYTKIASQLGYPTTPNKPPKTQ
jgi:hypothetical protein